VRGVGFEPTQAYATGASVQRKAVLQVKNKAVLGKDGENGFELLSPKNKKLFFEKCLDTASEDVCRQYLRYLDRPFDTNNKWSTVAYKKFYTIMCDNGVEEACVLSRKIKIKKANTDKYVPSLEEVIESIENSIEPYKTVFKTLLYTGLRLNETVFLLGNIDRLQVVRRDGYYRFYLGLERRSKKAFWAFTPVFLNRIIVVEKAVSDYARKKGLLAPKYYRKFVATKMQELGFPENVVDFIQGRTPQSILNKHYTNLLVLSDKHYPKYAEWLRGMGLV